MPRGRKPMVDLKIRREWLRLFEEEGWTLTQIAEQAKYDVRTVRNYVHMDSEDRQRKQATLMVYRDALQAHFHDMSAFAETLNARVQKGGSVTTVTEANPIIMAFREHTKRSPFVDKNREMEHTFTKNSGSRKTHSK